MGSNRIVWGWKTIFGVSVGCEYIAREEFEMVDHDALWSIMINLFCIRVVITSYPNE